MSFSSALPVEQENSEREESPLPYSRSIKDPIYDVIEVDNFFCQFIDTRQFQRLRSLKQLGTSYFVWPGASHNRFEHCLGVMHLAKTMVEHLSLQRGLNITQRDQRCVQLAGLLHDLGHGPFSHVFDGQFIPRARPNYEWKHEDASELMFEAMVQENEIDIPRQDIEFVRDLIAGKDRHPRNGEKSFLFEIVANKQNGIDVDKFDYILRDTHQIGGERCAIAALRLIKSSRVIDGHIAYSNKDITNVYLVFQERWSLHMRVYTHPAAKAIEYMVVDALLEADPYLKLSEQIDDPSRYVLLTDSILEEIERSNEPKLKPAQDIITRLRRRQLYKCVDTVHIHEEDEFRFRSVVTSDNISREANIIRMGDPETSELREVMPSDVIVDFNFLHFGMQNKNPIELVYFYGKHKPNTAIRARPEEYSQTYPVNFAEVVLRVFTRDRDLFGLVQAGFRVLHQKTLRNDTNPKTPARVPKSLGDSNITASGGSQPDIFDGNRFTSVPPSYSATGSPKGKGRRTGGLSVPSSQGSPVMRTEASILGLTGRTQHGISAKRSRELVDGYNEMDWVDEGSGKRLRKE